MAGKLGPTEQVSRRVVGENKELVAGEIWGTNGNFGLPGLTRLSTWRVASPNDNPGQWDSSTIGLGTKSNYETAEHSGSNGTGPD